MRLIMYAIDDANVEVGWRLYHRYIYILSAFIDSTTKMVNAEIPESMMGEAIKFLGVANGTGR